MRIPASIAAVLVPLALLAAACGDDDSDDGAASNEGQASDQTTEQSGADHNQADVEFAQMMIPHHREAVEMAELALERAEDPFIRDIAQRIQEAQDPEIEQMTGWLEEWGAEVPTTEASGGHDMGGDDSQTAGMMDELSAASGATFDQLFAEMMIEHHQGAIDMANEELDNGRSEEAKSLAEAIIEAQQAEITELEGFLSQSGE